MGAREDWRPMASIKGLHVSSLIPQLSAHNPGILRSSSGLPRPIPLPLASVTRVITLPVV